MKLNLKLILGYNIYLASFTTTLKYSRLLWGIVRSIIPIPDESLCTISLGVNCFVVWGRFEQSQALSQNRRLQNYRLFGTAELNAERYHSRFRAFSLV